MLASINPGNDLFEILWDSQAGFCFVNGDDDSLATAALRLAAGPELCARMGRNARQLLERSFSVQAAAQQILKCFETAAADRPQVAPSLSFPKGA